MSSPREATESANTSYRSIILEGIETLSEKRSAGHWAFLAVLGVGYLIKTTVGNVPTPWGVGEQVMAPLMGAMVLCCLYYTQKNWREEP